MGDFPEYRGSRPNPFQIEADFAQFNQAERARRNRESVESMNDTIAEIIAEKQGEVGEGENSHN